MAIYLLINSINIVVNRILVEDDMVDGYEVPEGYRLLLDPGNVDRGYIYTSEGFLPPVTPKELI